MKAPRLLRGKLHLLADPGKGIINDVVRWQVDRTGAQQWLVGENPASSTTIKPCTPKGFEIQVSQPP